MSHTRVEYAAPQVAFVLLVCFWQRLRRLWCPYSVFFDKLCIDQSCIEARTKGILGLAAFLDRSEHLVILWSDRYFSRLWCAYELGTFLRNPDIPKSVTLFPVAMSDMIALVTSLGMLYEITSKVSQTVTGTDTIVEVLGDVLVVFVLSPISCFVGLSLMKDLGRLDQQLQDFRVMESKCSCCTHDHVDPQTGKPLTCDRLLIYDMLRRWYGAREDVQLEHLERFDNVVRTSLRQSALRSADDAKMPAGLALPLSLMIMTPELVQGAGELPKESSLTEMASHFSYHYVLLVVMMALYFWLYFKLCKFGSELANWISIYVASFIIALMLPVSIVIMYAAVILPFFLERSARTWSFLPMAALFWSILTMGLFRGRWCFNWCLGQLHSRQCLRARPKSEHVP